MPHAGSARIEFRAGLLEDQLAERGELSLTAKRDLGRYYAVLQDELRRIKLTAAQASLLVDACNGILFEPLSASLLWANVDDAIQAEHLDQKWKVDAAPFVATLRALPLAALLALIDAIERFWRDPNPMDEALKRVGLVS